MKHSLDSVILPRIRIARVEDAERAVIVVTRSIHELCGPGYNNDEAILKRWCANKTVSNFEKWIADPNSYWVVAELDDSIVGVGAMTIAGEIQLCYVVPEWIGKGVGKLLLHALIRNAYVLGLSSVVLESTRTAHEFYRRNGFEDQGETVCMGMIPGYRMIRRLNEPNYA